MAERTLPTDGMSPIDGYSESCDRPLGYFEWAVPAGETAMDCVHIKVTDASTASATDYSRGLYVEYSNTGTKTGSAEVNAIGVDANATGNVAYLFPISIYTGTCTGATINHVAGIYMYIDNSAGTVSAKHGIWLQMAGGATESHFLSLHHQGGTINSMICSRSTGVTSTYFLQMFGAQLPYSAGSDSTNCDGKLACLIGSSTRYLHLFSD